MFSVEALFSQQELEELIQKDADEWINSLMEVYRTRGKAYVDRARAKTKSEGGFGNITWNLRGSIVMCIVSQGKIIETYAPPVSKGDLGLKIGMETAERLALYSSGNENIVMYIVAGMEYAAYVQSTDRDVIRGSSPFFEKEVANLFAA